MRSRYVGVYGMATSVGALWAFGTRSPSFLTLFLFMLGGFFWWGHWGGIPAAPAPTRPAYERRYADPLLELLRLAGMEDTSPEREEALSLAWQEIEEIERQVDD